MFLELKQGQIQQFSQSNSDFKQILVICSKPMNNLTKPKALIPFDRFKWIGSARNYDCEYDQTHKMQ